jgi:hypothetical protein
LRDQAREFCAVVLLDERERQVDAGRDSGRGVDRAVAHEDGVGIDVDRRIQRAEQRAVPPVRGGPPVLEQARGGQDEGARADRRHAAGAGGEDTRGIQQRGRDDAGGQRVVAAHHDRVRLASLNTSAGPVTSSIFIPSNTSSTTRRGMRPACPHSAETSISAPGFGIRRRK